MKQTSLEELVQIVDKLLGPGGCPWDQEQTHESLKQHLLEEAYEVLDAIDSGDSEKLKEELGDLLLQPIMHAQMEAAQGGFNSEDVAKGIVDKLIRRHPHVFGDASAPTAKDVLNNWDVIKKSEQNRKSGSIMEGIPVGMAALLRAHLVSKRAARVGFEWPDIDSVFLKLREEENELKEAIAEGDQGHIESELGDLLFTVVNLSRWCKVEPEEALRKMLNRFTERFKSMEAAAEGPLRELNPEQWEVLWNEAKLTSP